MNFNSLSGRFNNRCQPYTNSQTSQPNVRQLDTTLKSLFKLEASLSPESPEAVAVQARIAALGTLRKQSVLQTSLDKAYPGVDQLSQVFKSAIKTSAFSNPDSPELSRAQSTIVLAGKAMGLSDNQLQGIMIKTSRLSLLNFSGGLYSVLANLSPESPQASALQARLAAISNLDQTLARLEQNNSLQG